jgi:hypothetical protein
MQRAPNQERWLMNQGGLAEEKEEFRPSDDLPYR